MPPSRIWRALFIVATLASVAPLFAVEILPFTDVPEHLAVMASLRHWYEPAYRIQEHYEFALLRSQYLLYHLAGAGLSFAFGVDLANRLLLAAAGIAQPFAMRALLRAFGRDERLAIFAVPLFWNRALVVGFLPFVASLPVLLAALAMVVRQLDPKTTTRSREFKLALVAVAVFYLHASAFLILVLVGVALTLEATWSDAPTRAAPNTRARAGVFVRRLVWLAPAGAVATVWSILGRITLHGSSLSDDGEIGRINALRSARAFSLWAHDIFRSHLDEGCAVVYWAAFLALLATGLRHGSRHRVLSTSIPVLCVVALYFVLPFRVGAAAMLNVRMAPILALFALLPLEVAPGLVAQAALGVAFVVSLVTSANAAIELRAMVQEEGAGVVALFDQTRFGARIVSLPFDSKSRFAHFPPFIHMGAYHRVKHGGVSSFSFSELAHWPLQFRPEAAPPKKQSSFWSLNPCVFRNAEDGPYYDYVLVKGTLDPFRDEPPGPVWRPKDRVKDFTLYEKVEGRSWPAWSTPDRGPCTARVTSDDAPP